MRIGFCQILLYCAQVELLDRLMAVILLQCLDWQSFGIASALLLSAVVLFLYFDLHFVEFFSVLQFRNETADDDFRQKLDVVEI